MKDVMTVEELAEFLGASRSWVFEQTAIYKIPHSRLPGSGRGAPRYLKSVILEWLKEDRGIKTVEDERRLLDARRAA